MRSARFETAAELDPAPTLDSLAVPRRVALAGGGALVVRGRRGAAPVLFLHGLAGAAWSWEPQAVALAESRQTYAWEARGHGATAPVSDAGLNDYYEDAGQALAYVTASEGRAAIIAAHSLGALLALALAAARPADVAALFLVEPVYLTNSSSLSPLGPLGFLTVWGQAALFSILALAESFRYDTLPSRIYARTIFARSFVDRTAMEAAWKLQRNARPFEYRRLMLELAGASTPFPLRQFAREVVLPVHVVEAARCGSQMHFPNLIAQLRRLGPDFTRGVIRGGHYLQLDRAPAVTAQLREFAAKIDRVH